MTKYTPDFYKIFGAKKPKDFGGYPMPGMRKNLNVHTDPSGPINPGAEPDDDDDATYTEHLSDDADAGDDDEDDVSTDNDGADPNGAPTRHLNDLVEQLDKQQKEQAMKSRSLDVVKVCKAMAADGDAYGTSEHELVDWLDKYARAHDTTFAKLYERGDDVGLAIRKAVDIAKNAQFLSRTATLSKAQDARAVNRPTAAIDQLMALAAEQRKNDSSLSESGAFARVYEDKANAELVRREREENRPTSAAWGG
jgi:hypothetical protein